MPFPIIPAGTKSSGYTIAKSLRFRSSASAYLSRTPGTTGDRQKFTWSGWVKRGALSTSAFQALFGVYNSGTTDSDWFVISYIGTGGTPADAINISGWNTTYIRSNAIFRDPSAWYHIVVAVDTTSATSTITGTSTDRVRLYVNGVQVTAFNTANAPTQNLNTPVNYTVNQHRLGSINYSTGYQYFDGYLSEVNFIDGQALDPTNFGQTDTATGVWMPKAYTGTYGTNGFYLPFTVGSTSSYGASFNGSSQYLSATVGTSTIGSGDFTIEFWLNSTSATDARVFSLGNNNATGSLHIIYSGTYMRLNYETTTGATGTRQVSGGGWHHYALVRSGGTLKSYVDGVLDVNYGSVAANFNLTAAQIGANTALPSYFTGTLSNFRIATTAVYTANFTPPTSPLTAITGTTLLTLQSATFVDNSTNAYTITNNGSMTSATQYPFTATVGYDASGNKNNWVPININASSSGVTYDSMVDTPTNYDNGGNGAGNYCVLNPLSLSGATLSRANMREDAAAAAAVFGTMALDGKFYFEDTIGFSIAGFSYVGVALTTTAPTAPTTLAGMPSNYWIWRDDGNKANAGTSSAYGTAISTGQVGMVAYDQATGKLWFGAQGTWFGSGDPAVGTNPSYTLTAGTSVFPLVGSQGATGVTIHDVNFGQRPFTYTPPSGFKALNTQNLPTPTIGATSSTNAASYMNAVTYPGATAPNTVTATSSNSGNNPLAITFQPDFVWIKSRSAATDHKLTDSVRGVTKALISNTTGAETTDTNGLTAFTASGFTVGSDTVYNNTTGPQTYVAWEWLAGTAPTTDNVAGAGNVPTAGSVKINGSNSTSALAGSIAATRLSANVTAGFSVVGINAPGGTTFTFGHGLGAAPKMVIVKSRTSTASWLVYHASATTTSQYLNLNGTAAVSSAANIWGTSNPTSTVMGGNSSQWGTGTDNYIAYCFAEVAGYSKFGSYTGNGSADGPFVYCGFRPRYILTKRTDSTGNWEIYDTARDSYNVMSADLSAESSAAETSTARFDALSNGFKIRTTGAATNASGGTYIYAAFAETPFSYSRAR